MTPKLIVHRSADEIGGNCIELAWKEHRLILDIGRPLSAEAKNAADSSLLPLSLNVSKRAEGIIISHPHQDHYGLLHSLPDEWPVWCGAPTECLIKLTGAIFKKDFSHTFSNFKDRETFKIGPFSVTPFLTDHSAFDSHMLLVEINGKRIFYTGDFRFNGRKGALTERLMENPPKNLDVLLMEGTTLGRTENYPTETDLEDRFVELFRRTKGRVFVTWSAQNVDRTVTLYRACKKQNRTLVVDIYTAEVLVQLGAFAKIPQPEWPNIKVVITNNLKNHYAQIGKKEFVDNYCIPKGISVSRLGEDRNKWVIMTRKSLIPNYSVKSINPDSNDSWSFSMWKGYLKEPDAEQVQKWLKDSHAEHIHTSGHASHKELLQFANALSPKLFIPIHSFEWDRYLDKFSPSVRLKDGEEFELI